ncbi:hypothetical protein IE53DRAFT_325897 [Violaceomyces palustris]|uniref:Uncharacterized protein n=1 Tax=Violaceomyces palustris TaxID=1673888 RepID=A0ACD0P3Y1_9BASI|nr:hypothetical protein IE53DRAFT_325897 [Violaceomyces palustris]
MRRPPFSLAALTYDAARSSRPRPSSSSSFSFLLSVHSSKACYSHLHNPYQTAKPCCCSTSPSTSPSPSHSFHPLRPRHLHQAAAYKPQHPTPFPPAKHQAITPDQDLRIIRNEVGVQLLPRPLHRQLFPPSMDPIPPIEARALSISKSHLTQHGLDASQASTLPQSSFQLPPLQGKDLGEHFWNVGQSVAQPWLAMAHAFSQDSIASPPEEASEAPEEDFRQDPKHWLELDPELRGLIDLRPTTWSHNPGWTKYPVLTSEDGTCRIVGPGVSVPYPDESDDSLVFDVEVMVTESPFPVMATAAGPRSWYSWLSPWLVGEGPGSERKDHLIPFAPQPASNDREQPPRIIIGHNVSYDRARTLEEYSLERTSTRWIDTMSLHVATNGISSPQRPAWMKHTKSKAETRALKLLEKDELRYEARRAIQNALAGLEFDQEELNRLDLEELGDRGEALGSIGAEGDQTDTLEPDDDKDRSAAMIANKATAQWQDVTSKNSLAEVARLHCGIEVSKEARNVFIDGTPREEILANVDHLLSYCAKDVVVTHAVFKKVWPAFARNCPHPVTAAGVFGLGSTFLPVDDEWQDYKETAEKRFNEMNDEVQNCLVELAEKLKREGVKGVSWRTAEAAMASKNSIILSPTEARREGEIAWWESDPWYSQLDWTPKKPKKIKSGVAASPDGSDVGEGVPSIPTWYRDHVLKNKSKNGFSHRSPIVPLLLKLCYDGRRVLKREDRGWKAEPEHGSSEGAELLTGGHLLLSDSFLKKNGERLQSSSGELGDRALQAIRESRDGNEIKDLLIELANSIKDLSPSETQADPQLSQLDWTPRDIDFRDPEPSIALPSSMAEQEGAARARDPVQLEWWPKWYWELCKSGELQVTIRSMVAPLLLKISWRGCPLFRSRQHGWVFRHTYSENPDFVTRQKPLHFDLDADVHLLRQTLDPLGPNFYKVPHSEGESHNVGSPFSKNFVSLFEDSTLRSEHPDEVGTRASKTALDLNAQCSYWIAVRDRIAKQMVVWHGEAGTQMGYEAGASGARGGPTDAARKKGMIIPQVVSMGTVTRRATENTWLTASNAKKNRVGSELKSMVKAPPGWSIVGADVDSEELWICSVMGDAQFGIHGATAIGWMTLEGTKALGTDLHSKTASILGTSRNQAKVFNYSRIYGAGIKHATQLLLKANPGMSADEATKLAKELYVATKGQNTHCNTFFGPKFWFGGTESYVFNKLEGIALGENPQTPALGCGVTAALSKKYLGKVEFANGKLAEEYMPSRINWVVQSSGVDYLHLLIASMEYLCERYGIEARFMLSVHDEVRYLARDHDKYRASLALQISNLWTRAMFAFQLQMDDLPLGCAFFAQVDVDKVLRKEADDPCVTPSHPTPIPPGSAHDIEQILELTSGGDLGKEVRQGKMDFNKSDLDGLGYQPTPRNHRSVGERGLLFLQAQAAKEIEEVRALEARGIAMVRTSEEDRPNQAKSRQDAFRRTPRESSSSSSSGKRKASAVKLSLDEDSWVQQCAEGAEADGKSRRTRATNRTVNDGGSGGLIKAGRRPGKIEDVKLRSSLKGESTALSYSTAAMAREGGKTDLKAAELLDDLRKRLPKRPTKARVPFFRTGDHRRRVLWGLYRPLLKNVPKEFKEIREMIRRVSRSRRGCTSPAQFDRLQQGGRKLLDQFARAKNGDAGNHKCLQKLEKKLSKRAHYKSCMKAFDEYMKSENPPPVPRHSGALLPPSLFNPPLPRYKPVQPTALTMMIFQRRRARFRRLQRQADLEEVIRQVREESKIEVELARLTGRCEPLSSHFIDMAGWEEHFHDQRENLRLPFERDAARARMVFTPSMLRRAKQARRAKHRSALRKKAYLERERRIEAGER